MCVRARRTRSHFLPSSAQNMNEEERDIMSHTCHATSQRRQRRDVSLNETSHVFDDAYLHDVPCYMREARELGEYNKNRIRIE